MQMGIPLASNPHNAAPDAALTHGWCWRRPALSGARRPQLTRYDHCAWEDLRL